MSAIFEDSAGALWVGTTNGLNRFKDGQFTAYTAKEGVPAKYVRSICEDGAGAMWVGTAGGGHLGFEQGRAVGGGVKYFGAGIRSSAGNQDAANEIDAAEMVADELKASLRESRAAFNTKTCHTGPRRPAKAPRRRAATTNHPSRRSGQASLKRRPQPITRWPRPYGSGALVALLCRNVRH